MQGVSSSVRWLVIYSYIITVSMMAASQAMSFTTIINVPSDTAPDSIGSNTQLNVLDGGELDFSFDAGATNGSSTNVEVNVLGGTVGVFFSAYGGSVVNISGGEVGSVFDAHTGSIVNISGGEMGPWFSAMSGSEVHISGGLVGSWFTASTGSVVNIDGGFLNRRSDFESGSQVSVFGGDFQIDNVPISGLGTIGSSVAVNVPSGSILSGVLSDGTVAVFDGEFADGTLTLHSTAIPPSGHLTYAVPGDTAPHGLRIGQTLVVNEGAVVDGGLATNGATVQVNGGLLTSAKFYNSNVEISGGQVSGVVLSGSEVNMNGGFLIGSFSGDSSFNFKGGVVDDDFVVEAGGAMNIYGSEFKLNGVPVAGLNTLGETMPLNLADGIALSGTLEDGSVFIFANLNDWIADGTITLIESNIPTTTQMVYNLPADTPPTGLREGQTMYLGPDSELGTNFAASGATIHINGGYLGHEPEIVNTDLTMTDGLIGWGFDAHGDSVVNISGGRVRNYFDAGNGSTINITGGIIDANFDANPGSTVNIRGGSIHRSFGASAGSEVNIIGTSFILDGIDLAATMTPGVPITITDRDVLLSSVLLDGKIYNNTLRSIDLLGLGLGYMDPDATLTITLAIAGDLNGDGFVGIEDLNAVLSGWDQSVVAGNLLAGDPSGDGFVGIEDLNVVLGNWNAGAPPPEALALVPEPTSSAVIMLGVIVGTLNRKRG